MAPERQFKTPALILRRFDLGEADRVLTILTPRHGKFEVVAKGARKLTSRKTGHCELFTRADMLIHRGRDLGIAVQSEMSAAYLPLRDDLTCGALAGYVAELTDRFLESGHEGDAESSGAFMLLDATFARICELDDPRVAVRYFELHLLDLVGFRPELQECVIGHEPILPHDQFFSYAEGGVVCPTDAARGTSFIPLPLGTLKALRHLQRSRWQQIAALALTDERQHDLERIMHGYLTFVLERRLGSLDFLRRLRR